MSIVALVQLSLLCTTPAVAAASSLRHQAHTEMMHEHKKLESRAFRGIAAKLPDPMCKTGVLSWDTKVCCPSWCGECSDYPTCKNIRGQASTNTCCKSAVAERQCGEGKASARDCVPTCSEAVPPCIMDMKVKISEVKNNAKDDCHHAVEDWRAKAAAAIKTTTATSTTSTSATTTSTSATSTSATSTSATTETSTTTVPKRGLAASIKYGNNFCGILKEFQKIRPWFYGWNSMPTKSEDYKTCIETYDSGYSPLIFGKDSWNRFPDIWPERTDAKADALLGYNEPTHEGQAKVGPIEAAEDWWKMEWVATYYAIPRLGSPAGATCNDIGGKCYLNKNMITWFDEFFEKCNELNCKVDFLAVHYYTCSPLKMWSFLRGLFLRYHLPIWLTEFNCDGKSKQRDAQAHKDYMIKVLPIVEMLPFVERYSWSALQNVNNKGSALINPEEGGPQDLTIVGEAYRDFKFSSMNCLTKGGVAYWGFCYFLADDGEACDVACPRNGGAYDDVGTNALAPAAKKWAKEVDMEGGVGKRDDPAYWKAVQRSWPCADVASMLTGKLYQPKTNFGTRAVKWMDDWKDIGCAKIDHDHDTKTEKVFGRSITGAAAGTALESARRVCSCGLCQGDDCAADPKKLPHHDSPSLHEVSIQAGLVTTTTTTTTTAARTSPPPESTGCFEADWRWTPLEKNPSTARNAIECMYKCRLVTGCKHFSWMSGDGACHAATGDAQKKKKKKGWTSGPPKC